jgi:cephalosporin hydroxylase
MALTDRAKGLHRRGLVAADHIAEPFRRRTAGLRDREFMRELVSRTNNFGEVTWLGHPIWQNVLDLWNIQEAISDIRPSVLIETGTNRAGSALFYAHLFDLIGHGRVVTVDVERMHDIEHPRIEFLLGSSLSEDVLARMRAAASSADGPVLVILDSDHSHTHVAGELAAYHEFVTPGSLLLCQDGIIDELPAMAWARPGPLPAIHEFLAAHPEFRVDERYNRRFVVTHHPDGWLRKVQ